MKRKATEYPGGSSVRHRRYQVGPRGRRGEFYGREMVSVPLRSLGETKYMDSELQATAIAATTTTWVAGTILDPTTTINLGSAAVATPLGLCQPIVGAALNNRVGRSINVHKVKLNAVIGVAAIQAQASPSTSCKIRVLLVQDMQTNAAQMTGAQLLNDAGTASTTINSFQNPNFFGRFKVLKDKTMKVSDLNLAGDAASADQASQKLCFKMHHRFKKPVLVHFNATNGGTVADVIDNSFHVIAGCDSTSFAPQLAYYSRVTYKDV